MATPSESSEHVFTPGNVIQLADICELVTFEDLVAQEVEPYLDYIAWSGRLSLKDLIRPPKFNGTIADIELQVMEDPYERLQDARERGWQRPGIYALTSEFAEQLIPRYRGFALTANAKSTGRGTVGQIEAEMWYYPIPLHRHNGCARPQKSYGTGEVLRRVVARPKLEKEKFIELDATARRIGISLLRQSLAQPISTSMRD